MPVLVCLTFGDKLYAEHINEKGVHPHKDFMSTVVKEQLSVSVFVCTCSSIIMICVACITHCTLLPRNQSFYRQITSQEKGGAVSGVSQWCGWQQSTR